MKAIKLFEIGTMPDGVRRFQSQLSVGKSTADFIMETDGVIKCYGKGNRGFDFYEYKEPYIIITQKQLMNFQTL